MLGKRYITGHTLSGKSKGEGRVKYEVSKLILLADRRLGTEGTAGLFPL